MNMHAKRTVFYIILALGILSANLIGNILLAQGPVQEVIIPTGGVDISGFPTVQVRAIVSDDRRSRVTGLTTADFTLREDGRDIPFQLDEIQIGIQAVFVLDASLSVRQPGSTGYTRLEEGKQVIQNFAKDYMAEGIDQIAVLAPQSSTAVQKVAPLPDDPAGADFTVFKNTVHDGTMLYELPEGITNTPLNDMVSTALNMLASAETGMHKAVVVISDGIDTISDREVADIVNKANQLGVPIYTVIFGPSSNWGGQPESNMKRLSLDSHGEHFQLSAEGGKPDPIEDLVNQSMAPLYENLSSQRLQYQLTFSSQISAPGAHEIAISVGSSSTKTSMPVSIKPPDVSIAQPSSGLQIERRTDDPSLSAEEIDPRTQTVVFDVSFPDGYNRAIETVELVVDGVAVPDACLPPCNEIVWNIAELPAGPHSIRIRVRDQQGLEGESASVPVNISIVLPTPIPTLIPTPTRAQATALPPVALTCEEQYSGFTAIMKCNQEVLAFGALGISFVALLLAIVVIRRPPQVMSTMVRRVKEATEPFFLDQARMSSSREVKATLEVVEGDDTHTQPIELVSENTRFGRDEELVQVVFANRAVSRLHARISVETDQQGVQRFVLYDEGSTSGTYVNFEPVGINGQWLQHNDTIHLGPVRLQFKMKGARKAAHDDTVAMRPIRPGTEIPEEDAFATAPYEPAQPVPDIDHTQPIPGEESAQQYSPPDVSDEDEDDGLSTEPYVPMDFGDG